MKSECVFCAGKTPAMDYCRNFLSRAGVPPAEEAPKEKCWVLLDVPSFRADGCLRSGQPPETILDKAHPGSVILGGKLNQPCLEGRRTIDILEDETYLQENARITAFCALKLAAQAVPTILPDTKIMVIGWGRIGKILARQLRNMGAGVTVCVRNPVHLEKLNAMGYTCCRAGEENSADYRLILNTGDDLTQAAYKNPDAVILDLASHSRLRGNQVIPARGLPGIHAPESSGKLLADTVLRIIKEVPL